MIVAFAFILPLSRALISLIIILLILFWLLEGDFKNKLRKIKENRVLLSFALFLLWGMIISLFSIYTEDISRTLRLNLYLLGIFVIATSIKKEQIPTIITAFLSGMFISEIIAYGVFFELWTFKHATPTNPSPFMIHIDYSVFLAFSSILLLNRLFSPLYSLKEKLFLSFFFLTVTGNLFLSTGRTGQVAFIAAIFVLSIIHFRFTLKSLLVSALLLTTIFFTAYSLSSSFQMRIGNAVSDISKMKDNNLNSSWGIRVAFWITTFDAFQEHPMGYGLGGYRVATAKEIEKHEYPFLNNSSKAFMSDAHPHNQYLLVLLQSGFIGLLLFLNVIYQLLVYKIKDKEIKEISVLFTTIYFVSCLAEPLLIKQFTLVLFVLFIGLFTATDLQEGEEITS